MHLVKALRLTIFLLQLHVVLPLPLAQEKDVQQARRVIEEDDFNDFVRRGDGSSEASPKDMVIDIARFSESLEAYERDCMVILCFDAPRVL